MAWFSRTGLFRTIGPTIMPPLESAMRFVTGGRVQLSGLLVPSLVLHSIGARSGRERDAELMYYPDAGNTFVIAGSNFARESHPAWTANLLAHPEAAVSIKGRRIPVSARLLSPDETEATWALVQRQWPDYRKYETTSGRTIRMFRLTPNP